MDWNHNCFDWHREHFLQILHPSWYWLVYRRFVGNGNHRLSSYDFLSIVFQFASRFRNYFCRLDHGRRPENSGGTGTDRLINQPFKFMNANEISSKTNRRLNRIRKGIWGIRILIGLAVVCVVAFNLIFLSSIIGWTDISPRSITFPPFSTYSSARAIPASLLILGFIRAGFIFAGALVLNRLLRYFAGGSFFTATTITCIKWLGYLVIGDWVVVKFLQAFG